MDASIFQILWFWLIALLIGGYFVLDGFDLGAGALYPFIAKNEKEKAIVRRSIGPVWDGNEVWLLTAGGALFAAFPLAYATTFSGFYLAIMLVLFSLIVRAVSLEFRSRDKKWKKIWDVLFFIGSALPALLLGVAAGNVLQGVPLAPNGDVIVSIPVVDLLTPFPLVCGVLGLVLFLAQGAAWVALKAPKNSPLHKRSIKLRMPLQAIGLVVFVLATVLMLFVVAPQMADSLAIVRYGLAALFVVGLVVAIFMRKSDVMSFLAQSASLLFLVFLWGASQFPNLVPATQGTSIDIVNGASPEMTLIIMSVITAVGVPLVLFYHFILYRAFRGRITDADLTY
ncbi:MAG: cytochrome d ubiquinol oxidase subunit II [Coriobacteriia bacterium]|nr:cytochrome d ubiquinol oxidase subunit II [Coriobacteriia bacterium]MCL2750377.1 cytochrome d ubiquinol oxidase subunit II [Coriobacteriia bacterium]